MDLAGPVPVIVPSVLARRMADRLVAVAPLLEPGLDVVLVGVDRAAHGDRPSHQRADRRLLDIGQHPDHHLTAPLDHPEDRRLLLGQRPPAPLPFPAPPPGWSASFSTAWWWPLCPATT